MAQIQNVNCSDPVDTTELHFKLVKRNEAVKYSSKPSHTNLLAVAHSLGLTFLGANDGFQVINTNSVSNDTYLRKFVKTQCKFVTHVTVNADETLLAVGGSLEADGCVSYIYPLNTITESNYIQESNRVKLSSTPGVAIVDLSWNPASFKLLSACFSDGSIALVDIKSSSSMEFNSLPSNAAARCFCWSPKGKQLVVGGEDGKLTQYKPDLTPAKSLPAPNVFDGAASVASVIWISNFQFGAIYRDRNQPAVSPTFIIVNAFKNEPVTFIHYGDITYGSSQFRFPQFYFHHQPQWNLLLVSSANSVELGVLHLGQDGRTWEQWVVGDSSRAEMPLTADQDETFPYGMAVDLSSQTPVRWMETHIPPVPRLVMISSEGVLCLYNVVNLVQGAPVICSPPSKAVASSFFDAPIIVEEPIAVAEPVKAIPVELPVAKVESIEAPPPEVPISQPISNIQKEEPPPYTPPREPSPPPPAKEPEPEVDDSVYDAAIIEEVVALDDDLSALFNELKIDQLSELGPEEEFSQVVQRLGNLAEFQKDVDETTEGQAEEISELKLEVLELTAKSQDVRLVKERRNNHFGNQLQRSENLDPVLARILREILGMRTFVENQLKQVTHHLDKQWEEHQQACRKDAKSRMKTPMMEDIFNTISLIKKLVISQKITVDRLQKEIDRGVWTSPDHRPDDTKHDLSRVMELSKLADSLLGMTITGEKPKTDVSQLVANVKRQNIDNNEFTAQEMALLLDRFEDSTVPEVSHCLSFADREAHKKEVAARLKAATDRMQKREKERQESLVKSTPPPKLVIPTLQEKPVTTKPQPVAREIFSSKPFAIAPTPTETVKPSSIGLFGDSGKKPEEVKSANERSVLKTTSPEIPKTVAVTSTSAFSFSTGSKSLFSNQTSGLFKSGSAVTITPVKTEAVKPQESSKSLFSIPVEVQVSVPSKPTVIEEKNVHSAPETKKTESTVSITPIENKTTTSPSLFGSLSITPVSSGTGLFSNIAVTPVTTTSTGSSFSTNTKSLFSPGQNLFGNSSAVTTATTAPVAPTTTDTKATTAPTSFFSSSVTITTTSSLFGGLSSTTTSSLFGSNASTTTSTSQSIFGGSAASTPTFGKTPLFGTPATTASTGLFSPSTTTPSTTTSIFSSTVTTTSSGIFGSTNPPATTPSTNVFATTPTTGGIFGAATTVSTATSPSVFGSTGSTPSPGLFAPTGTTTTTTTASVFGSSTPTTSAGLFGSTAATTTTSSVFGTPLFSTPTTTTATGLFGSFTQTPATTAAAVFGTPTMPTAVSGFGTDINQTANLFGQMLSASTPSSTPQTNIFAQTPQKSGFDTGGNIFGGTTPASTSSLFGSTTTNVFGQTTSPSISQTGNIFGQQTPTTSGSSFFGQNICSPFGSGSAAPNQSPFGSPVAATTQSAFGSSSFNKPIFGQSVFGQTGSTSLFGGSNQQQQSGSIFGGNTSGGSFQTNSFSGPFSSGSGTVAQSGFGAASSFSKPAAGGFGSAPVFGGAPAATAFGSTPAFGSSLPFGAGSPTKVFGSPGSTPVFGQQQASGFESLATQNTVGFGNLAQMPAQQQGFGSGFSSPQQNTFGAQQPQQQQSPSFGGSSFSSWR